MNTQQIPVPKMRVLGPGSIEVGMYIVGYQTRINATISKKPSPPRFLSDEYEKTDETVIIWRTPWLQGIPYRVISVALPFIMVENLIDASARNPLPPIIIFDSRMSDFIEVNSDYAQKWVLYHAESVRKNIMVNPIIDIRGISMVEYAPDGSLTKTDRTKI